MSPETATRPLTAIDAGAVRLLISRMARVVALLRGINVGGHRVAMADLRRHIEALKFRHVSTFIASGNVIFDVPDDFSAPALEQRIEKHLRKVLGFEAPTIVRSLEEIETVAAFTPFPRLPAEHVLHVCFLRTPLDADIERAVLALKTDMDDLRTHGRELYWLYRGRMSSESIIWPKLEKVLRPVVTTSRNMKSVRKLAAAMRGAAD